MIPHQYMSLIKIHKHAIQQSIIVHILSHLQVQVITWLIYYNMLENEWICHYYNPPRIKIYIHDKNVCKSPIFHSFPITKMTFLWNHGICKAICHQLRYNMQCPHWRRCWLTIVHLSMRSAQNIMGTKRTRSETWDLWRRWWEGPSDSGVGEGHGHWKHLTPTETKSHKGIAMSYV